MIRRSSLILIEIVVGLAATLALGLGLVWWRLASGPIPLGPLERHVEAELAIARGGRPVDVEAVTLAWSAQARALEVKAAGLTFLSETGAPLSKSTDVRLGFSVRQLALGRIALERVSLAGAEATLTFKADKSAAIAFGPPGSAPDIIIPAPPPEETLQARVNRILDGLAAALRPVGPGGGLRSVQFETLTVNIIEEATGQRWRLTEANAALAREETTLQVSAAGALAGPRGAAPIQFSAITDTAFQAAIIEAKVEKARLAALAPPSLLGPFAGLDAPATVAVSAALDRKEGVSRLEGEMVVGRGVWRFRDGAAPLDGGQVRGRYNVADDDLIIEEAALAGAATRVKGEARLADASRLWRAQEGASTPFEVEFESLSLEMPGVLAAPTALRAVRASGAIHAAKKSIDIARLEAEVGQARAVGSGRLFLASDNAGSLRLGAAGEAAVEGVVTPQEVLALWPIQAGASAREWAALNVLQGTISDVKLKLAITPAMTAAGQLADAGLTLDFKFRDARVSYVEGMTPITAGSGKAQLRGNSFDLTLDRAAIGPLAITQGKVSLPKFKPKGALATFSGVAEGEARAMVDLLLQAPIGLAEVLPVDAASLVGQGRAAFTLRRPMLNLVPPEDYRFTVDAAFTGVGGRTKDGAIAASDWRLAVKGDQQALTFSGPLTLSGRPGNLSWTQAIFDTAAPPSRFSYAGVLPATEIERMGYPIGLFAQGDVGVQVSGEGEGLEVAKADVTLDLTPSTAFLPRGFYYKAPGAPAKTRFAVARLPDGDVLIKDATARGPGLELAGRLQFTPDGRIREADIVRAEIVDRVSAAGTMRLSPHGVLAIEGRGAMMHLGVLTAPPPEAAKVDASAAYAALGEAATPISAALRLRELRFNGGAALTDGRVSFRTDGRALTTLDMAGADPQGRPVALTITPRGDGKGAIRFTAPDAGFAWLGLTGQDTLRGGTASAEGEWRPGAPSTAGVHVVLRDFQLVNMPVMARLLSSVGSLQGMADMLNGDGIAFTTLDAPMSYANGRLMLEECRMSGPSLGLTAKGKVDLETGALQIDGVVVPSYALNSLISNVPLVGELLASRRGEGVLGITYSMKGPADDAKVGVNPLSALTPGILRRIFEPLPQREATPTPAGARATARQGANR